MPPHHQQVIRTIFDKLTDLDGAIPILKNQIDTNKTAIVASTSTSSTSSSSASGVTAAQAANIATGTIQSTLNNTNNQTGTSYTVENSDYAAIITLNNAASVAVTLGGDGTGVGPQFGTYIENIGAGVATLTPASGTVNLLADIQLVQNQGAILFYDGSNWTAITSIPGSGGTITDVIAGTGLSGGGSSGAVTLSLITPVSIADGGTGTATPGLIAGSGITITGSWPDQTIASSGGAGYLKGTITINFGGASTGTFSGSVTISGVGANMACAFGNTSLLGQSFLNYETTSGGVVQLTVILNSGVGLGTVNFPVAVFP